MSPLLRTAFKRPLLLLKAARRLVTHGPRATLAMARAVARPAAGAPPWAAPAAAVDMPALEERARAAMARGGALVSVVMPVHDPEPAFLRAALHSVLHQPYGRLQLVLVDDASADPAVRAMLREAAARDRRVRLVTRPERGGISRATNDGVEAATGAWTAFLDHDDELAPEALTAVAERLLAEPELQVLYTDQLKIDAHGRVVDHHLKPDWSPALLLGVMYVGHLLLARTELVRAAGGCDPAFDGVQDYDLMLRLSQRTAAIGHLAQPLYRWRAAPGSLAADADAKPGIETLQKRALLAHLARLGRSWGAEPHPAPAVRHRMLLTPGPRDTEAGAPRVSVVIPSRDQGEAVARCLDSLHRIPAGVRFETVVVDDATTDPVALAAFARHPVRRVPLHGRFTFSHACNQGAACARGELLLFLNNDTEVLEAGWLARLALWMEDEGVGAVGPVLLYPDRTVQHAGVVLGARGTADHVMRRFPAGVDGYAGSLAAAREVSAVTGACLLLRAAEFRLLGCFSTDYLRHYQDVDLCLRLRAEGKRIVCASRPTLIHHESLSRGAPGCEMGGYDMGDRAILHDRWREQLIAADPYYPAACDRERLDYSLAAA